MRTARLRIVPVGGGFVTRSQEGGGGGLTRSQEGGGVVTRSQEGGGEVLWTGPRRGGEVLWPGPRRGGGAGVVTRSQGGEVLWPGPRREGGCCDQVPGGGGGRCCDQVPGGGGGVVTRSQEEGRRCCDQVPGGGGGAVTRSQEGGGGVVTRSLVHSSPPGDRMTNTCENITFARFATRAVETSIFWESFIASIQWIIKTLAKCMNIEILFH